MQDWTANCTISLHLNLRTPETLNLYKPSTTKRKLLFLCHSPRYLCPTYSIDLRSLGREGNSRSDIRTLGIRWLLLGPFRWWYDLKGTCFAHFMFILELNGRYCLLQEANDENEELHVENVGCDDSSHDVVHLWCVNDFVVSSFLFLEFMQCNGLVVLLMTFSC